MTAVDSPEKILFESTTQAFCKKRRHCATSVSCTPRVLSFDPAWWRRAAELGWTGLLVPEELGGGSVSDSGVADLAMVAEQLGKTVAPGPLYPVSIVLAGLVDCADPQAHADTIESLMSGETVASWAVCEPGRGWAPLRAVGDRYPDRLRLPHRRHQGPGRGGRPERGAACGGTMR